MFALAEGREVEPIFCSKGLKTLLEIYREHGASIGSGGQEVCWATGPAISSARPLGKWRFPNQVSAQGWMKPPSAFSGLILNFLQISVPGEY